MREERRGCGGRGGNGSGLGVVMGWGARVVVGRGGGEGWGGPWAGLAGMGFEDAG